MTSSGTDAGRHRPAKCTGSHQGRGAPFAPIILPLIEKAFDEEATRVAENGDEPEDPHPRAGDADALLPEIDSRGEMTMSMSAPSDDSVQPTNSSTNLVA